jgi:ferric-dicitrate binding protein FerR (iron transport regulator)
MNQKLKDITDKFLNEESCTKQELIDLKDWLTDINVHSEVESWLAEHWSNSSEVDSNLLIESVYKQIQEYQHEPRNHSTFSFYKVLKVYQKVAAILLIPVIGFGILYWANQQAQSPDQFSETIAPRGQKSQIVLSDGTRVWLNSDTKIKYPGNFNQKQRNVYLDGEAFFEVASNARKPFVVHTSGIKVKVLGTKFNLKAYSDEDQIEASLFEGKINLEGNGSAENQIIEKEVLPGQSFVYSRTEHELEANRFPEEEINGWKKNQLIFKDDTFGNLVRKVERWYDVKVVYDEKQFYDRRLTFELYEGEQLERLMEVIGLALSVDYKYSKGEIFLTPKAKKM